MLQFCLVNVRSLAVYFTFPPSQCNQKGEIRQAQGRNRKPKNGFEYIKDSPHHCLDAGLLVLMQDWAFLRRSPVLDIRFFH